jgi:hypothetical protein
LLHFPVLVVLSDFVFDERRPFEKSEAFPGTTEDHAKAVPDENPEALKAFGASFS